MTKNPSKKTFNFNLRRQSSQENIEQNLINPDNRTLTSEARLSRSSSEMKAIPIMNFLDNFDPETSARERRKINRKSYFCRCNDYFSRKIKTIYNEKGHIATTGKDLCDCLDETCPGCHFPCPKCSSHKCGHECRVNRKWMYDKIEIEGNDFVIKNDYK